MKWSGADREHPEQLLDRARTGRLDAQGRSTLRQHLSTCDVCAAHLWLASLSDQETPPSAARTVGPPTTRDHHLTRLAAERALGRLANLPAGTAGTPSRRRVGQPTFRARRLQVSVIALLLTGTTAAAAWWAVREAPGPATTEPTSWTNPVDGARRNRQIAPPPFLDESPELNDDLTAGPLPPVVPQAAPPDRTGRGKTGTMGATAPSGVSASSRRGRDKHHGLTTSPAQLLELGRRLRLQGDSAGAQATYVRLQKDHPASPESHISHLLLGRLGLETNDLEQAAREFSRYLGAGGAASEEALVGRATALARLGRVKDEAAAWRALLNDHPRSLHAPRARSRLDVLQGQR